MSTLQEIKAAAALLPTEDRNALATWLNESEDVSRLRREQLKREIQKGLHQIEAGDVAPLDMDVIKRTVRSDDGIAVARVIHGARDYRVEFE